MGKRPATAASRRRRQQRTDAGVRSKDLLSTKKRQERQRQKRALFANEGLVLFRAYSRIKVFPSRSFASLGKRLFIPFVVSLSNHGRNKSNKTNPLKMPFDKPVLSEVEGLRANGLI
jgi:hypothetical protein